MDAYPDMESNRALWEKLTPHIGHEIVVVSYGVNGKLANVAVECERCNEVLVDANNPDFE